LGRYTLTTSKQGTTATTLKDSSSSVVDGVVEVGTTIASASDTETAAEDSNVDETSATVDENHEEEVVVVAIEVIADIAAATTEPSSLSTGRVVTIAMPSKIRNVVAAAADGVGNEDVVLLHPLDGNCVSLMMSPPPPGEPVPTKDMAMMEAAISALKTSIEQASTDCEI
jgi:prephenate dehydrogenase